MSVGYCNRHFTGYQVSTGCPDCNAMAAEKLQPQGPQSGVGISGFSKYLFILQRHAWHAMRGTRRIVRWVRNTDNGSIKVETTNSHGHILELQYMKPAVDRLRIDRLEAERLYDFTADYAPIHTPNPEHLPRQVVITKIEPLGYWGRILTMEPFNGHVRFSTPVEWHDETPDCSKIRVDYCYHYEPDGGVLPHTEADHSLFFVNPTNWKHETKVIAQ